MDSFEFNKIAGGALSALLFMFGLPQLASVIGGGEHGGGHGEAHAVTAGYTLPMPKGGASHGGGAPAADAFSFAKVAALLPKANADAGKDTFKACAQCHTAEKGGAAKQGPNLYGIVGRDVGKAPGFSYSAAVAEKGGKWTWELLTNYLHSPRETIPGNKMSFAGVKDENELADLLTYLRTLSDSPAPLPAVPAAAKPADKPADKPAEPKK
ncbi:MAG: cytochrome c family protein [Hyphomicrobiaceae bacterium]